MDIHYVDSNGNHFVVPDAPDGYDREDAYIIDPPPSSNHVWIDGGWKLPNTPPETNPLSLRVVASADLSVENGELVEVGRNLGFSMAFMPDPDTAWIFFDKEQEDVDYIVTPSTGISKYEDMIEIHKPNATSFKVLIQRLV